MRSLPDDRAPGEVQQAGRRVPGLVYVDHLTGSGARILSHACRMSIEGIISKRADSPYRSGRSTAWVKTKCERSDTFVVVGFEVDKDRPRHLAGLHLDWRHAGKLSYAGSVELGIDDATALELRKALDPLARTRSPLPAPVKGVKPTWVQPELLVEVAFPNASEEGRLRHPKFKGTRKDP